MFGLSWKDVAVGVASMVGGPLAGAAVGGIWTGIETGSVTEGLKAAAIDGAMSAVPGGRLVGGALERMAAPLAERAVARVAGDTIGGDLAALGTRGVAGTVARGVGRAVGGAFGSSLTPDGSKPPDPTLGSVPVRLAGTDTNGNPFGGTSSSASLSYDKYGLAQYPTSGQVEIKLANGKTVNA